MKTVTQQSRQTTTISDLPMDLVRAIDSFNTIQTTKAVINDDYEPGSNDPVRQKRLRVEVTDSTEYNLCKALNGWACSEGRTKGSLERRGLVALQEIPIFVFKNGQVPGMYHSAREDVDETTHRITFANWLCVNVTVKCITHWHRHNPWFTKKERSVFTSVTRIIDDDNNNEERLFCQRQSMQGTRCGCKAPVFDTVKGEWRMCKRLAVESCVSSSGNPLRGARQFLCKQHVDTVYDLEQLF